MYNMEIDPSEWRVTYVPCGGQLPSLHGDLSVLDSSNNINIGLSCPTTDLCVNVADCVGICANARDHKNNSLNIRLKLEP